MKNIFFFLIIVILFQCKIDSSQSSSNKTELTSSKSYKTKEVTEKLVEDSDNNKLKEDKEKTKEKLSELKKENWVELSEKDGFMMDIKYATTDNFTKKVIYDCSACFLRPEVAQALMDSQEEIKTKYGYSIKLLDCYRPGPFQQRLWDVMPDKNYVAPPEKGSMHSRGTAIDLTLVDSDGQELDMGTPFDFFGEEAHQDYKGHNDKVNRHRYILRSTMKKYGLEQIRTEWWHYSYRAKTYPLEDWVWPCR